jgi:prepilin-type N-terminal cleavage/methylation domain-containing protein
VPPRESTEKQNGPGRQGGFSLVEMLVALVILLGVAGIVMTGLMQMTFTQATIQNRSEMHSSVRSATELLEQEIGQAGKVSLYGAGTGSTSLTSGVAIGNSVSTTVADATGMFEGEQLVIDAGSNEETVKIANSSLVLSTNTFKATYTLAHANGTPVRVAGAFASGILPTTASNGSGPNLLKLYGDINADYNMEYVEYTCTPSASGGSLYRNVVNIAPGATKPGVASSMILLSNVLPNPPDPGTTGPAPCFKYQQKTVGPDTYVVDVSVTLTVQTQNKDPQTHQFQQETKALLNVSPRNIFDGWELASAGVPNRIQPIPSTVTSLLP